MAQVEHFLLASCGYYSLPTSHAVETRDRTIVVPVVAELVSQHIGEAILCIALVGLMVRFALYRQPASVAFVRDDSRTEPLEEIVRGGIDPNTALFADCAALCAKVYDAQDEERAPLAGWTRETKSAPGSRVFGLKYDVWRRTDPLQYALVFRGTLPYSASSWVANLHWVFRLVPFFKDQYDQLKIILPELVDRICADTAAPPPILATGHSLGGGLAQHALYLDPRVKLAIAFNSSPVTGWSDVKPDLRERNVRGCVVYRVHENGEALEFGRLLMKMAYVFNPGPNRDPYFVEYRINLRKGWRQHGIDALAAELAILQKKSRAAVEAHTGARK